MLQCYFCVLCQSFFVGDFIFCNRSQYCVYRLTMGNFYTKSCGFGDLVTCDKWNCVCNETLCNNPSIYFATADPKSSSIHLNHSYYDFNYTTNELTSSTSETVITSEISRKYTAFTSPKVSKTKNVTIATLTQQTPIPWMDIGLAIGILSGLILSVILVWCLMLRKFR